MKSLLDHLANSGVTVSIENNNINLRGNVNLLTPLILRELRQKKNTIISYLQKTSDVNQSGDGYLIKLRHVESSPTIFMIHPIGGTVSCYWPIIQYLDPDYSVYAVQARGLNDGYLPFDTIEKLASCYSQLIRNEQPVGPYYLAGWSLGGIIAYTIASIIEGIGQRVSFLGLIDSLFPNDRKSSLEDTQFLLMLFLKDLFGNQDKSLAADGTKIKGLDSAYQWYLDKYSTTNLMDYNMFSNIFEVFQHHNKALIEHVPKHHKIALYHFVADSRSVHTESSINLWHALTYKQQIIRMIPGDHYSIMNKTNIKHLAYEFNKAFKFALKAKNLNNMSIRGT